MLHSFLRDRLQYKTTVYHSKECFYNPEASVLKFSAVNILRMAVFQKQWYCVNTFNIKHPLKVKGREENKIPGQTLILAGNLAAMSDRLANCFFLQLITKYLQNLYQYRQYTHYFIQQDYMYIL